MSVNLEQMFSEIQQQGINTGKQISSTATGQFAATTVTGNAAVNGNQTVGGTFTVTGVATLGVTGTANPVNLGSGGPQLISGTLTVPNNPTGVSAPAGSIFINLGATGVTNRAYINTNGATGWTYLGTSGA